MSRPLDRIPPAAPRGLCARRRATALGARDARAIFASHPERREPFVTQALKWPIKPLYTPADLEAAGFDYLRDLGFPG